MYIVSSMVAAGGHSQGTPHPPPLYQVPWHTEGARYETPYSLMFH